MYKITITVEDKDLGTVVSAIQPYSKVPLAIVHQEGTAKRQVKNTGGLSPKSETRSGRLILEQLRTGPCSRADLTGALVAAGYSPTSLGPILSGLRTEGLISTVDGSVFQLEGAQS